MIEKVRRSVVALTTSYPLRASSWAGIFIQKVYEHLPASQVVVVCPADDRPLDVASRATLWVHAVRYAPMRWRRLAQQSGGVAPGLRHRPWRVGLIPPLLISLAWRTFIQGRTADIVHANWAICGAIAALVGRLRPRPLVTTLRGDDVKRAKRTVVDRWLLNLAVSGSHQVVCVSEAMANDLRAFSPANAAKIAVVHNGVDDVFLSVSRAPAPPDVVRIGAVGSLIPRKGFDVLLSALALMKHRGQVHLSLVGGGPERSRLGDQAKRLGIEENLRFVGEISPVDMPGFLAGLDLFVLSSRSEGRPNVVIEALASGLPVVSTNLPGVVGLVDPGISGWLVAQEDPQAMADALDTACSDPARSRRMGEAAQAKMRTDGGWIRAAAEYQSIFDRVIDAYRGVG